MCEDNSGTTSKVGLYKIAIVIPFIIFAASIIIPKLSVRGKNIKIYSTTDSEVYFKIVCPECHHIEGTYSVELSKGENHSTFHVCNKCGEVFDVEIKR